MSRLNLRLSVRYREHKEAGSMGKPMGFLEYERKTRPERDPAERLGDFREFHLPLNKEECERQAARCMDCGIPFCQSGTDFSGRSSGCPLHNLIPEYNDQIFMGNWKEAAQRLLKTNNFPEFTGRVCPALCENACVCGINDTPVTTHDNEYAVIEEAFAKGWVVPRIPRVRSGKKVAIVGSGPAGLAAADCLNQRSHQVTIFEKADMPGGLLMYGIPNMKLDKEVIRRRIDLMENEGVEFILNTDVGRDISALDMLDRFDAIVLCCGSRKPRDINVPGRDASGVYFAVDYLTDATKTVLGLKDRTDMNAGKKNVVILGGGDTGNDCVATALRQGCRSVVQLDRNPMAPLNAEGEFWPLKKNVYSPGYGQEEAICRYGKDPRMFSTTVKEIHRSDDGAVNEIVTIEIRKNRDKNGRIRITEIENTEKTIPCDMLILATGFAGCDDYVADAFGLERTASGTLAGIGYSTNAESVFAAGDVRRGASLVVWAIAEGRKCAKAVDSFLMGYSNM